MTPPNVAVYFWIRQAFDFRSRSTRADYWWPQLFVLFVYTGLIILFVSGLNVAQSEAVLAWAESGPQDFTGLDISPLGSLSKFALTSGIVFMILTFIPILSVSWRRFQDMGKPGWLHILFLVAGSMIPFVSVIEYIWFAFPGTNGPNQYGPDKRGGSPDIY